MSQKQEEAVYRPNIVTLGNGLLFQAQVQLPDRMCPRDQPIAERLVFFESPSYDANQASKHLMALLNAAWCTDTSDTSEWHPDMIYNIRSADSSIRHAWGDKSTGELRLLECGLESKGFGPDRIHYWRAKEVDALVSPRVAVRLRELLDQVEALYRKDSGGPDHG